MKKIKLNSSVEFELSKLKEDLDNAMEEALSHSREGKRKTFLQNLASISKNYTSQSIDEKVESLTKVFDQVIDEDALYQHLTRRLEKFYNLILGKFYRIILPELIKQEALTRIELRLYILMNLPLKFFNYHPTDEKIISQFLGYNSNIQSEVFKTLILRNRVQNNLEELVPCFILT